MYFNRRMIKQMVVDRPHGTQHSDEKEWASHAHNSMGNSPGNYVQWKRPIPKGYILHDVINKTLEMTKL